MDRYRVEGMTCAACSAHVDKAVRKLPFVEDVQVDLLGKSMRVKTNDGQTHEQDIETAVEHAGYQAISDRPTTTQQPVKREKEPMKFRFWVSLVFLIPLMLIGMGQMLGLSDARVSAARHIPDDQRAFTALAGDAGAVCQPRVFHLRLQAAR